MILTLAGCQTDRAVRCEAELEILREHLVECEQAVMPELEFGVAPCEER